MPTLIIGSGYLGSFIKQAIPNSKSTSLVEGEGDFTYDLKDGIQSFFKDFDSLIITCDITPLQSQIIDFSSSIKKYFKNIILISTASSFKVEKAKQEVDENTVREGLRSQLEESFIDSAYILSLGLLWDNEKRRPERWFPRIKNGSKLINLCNSQLVAQICNELIKIKPQANGHYIVCDGKAMTWQELSPNRLPKCQVGIESKALKNKKIVNLLHNKIKFSDFLYHK